jgi:hypothetical protein
MISIQIAHRMGKTIPCPDNASVKTWDEIFRDLHGSWWAPRPQPPLSSSKTPVDISADLLAERFRFPPERGATVSWCAASNASKAKFLGVACPLLPGWSLRSARESSSCSSEGRTSPCAILHNILLLISEGVSADVCFSVVNDIGSSFYSPHDPLVLHENSATGSALDTPDRNANLCMLLGHHEVSNTGINGTGKMQRQLQYTVPPNSGPLVSSLSL